MSTEDEYRSRTWVLQNRGAELIDESAAEIDLFAYQVGGHLHSAFTIMKALVERGSLGESNLSLTAFIALWSIWVGGEMEGREVAEEIGIARSSFSELAQRLEQRGLIKRGADPSDGRVVLFSVTDEGADVVRKAWPRMNAEMQQLTAVFADDERSLVVDHLRRMVDQLEQMWNAGK